MGRNNDENTESEDALKPVTVRLPRGLHRRIKVLAAAERTTIQELLRRWAEEAMSDIEHLSRE